MQYKLHMTSSPQMGPDKAIGQFLIFSKYTIIHISLFRRETFELVRDHSYASSYSVDLQSVINKIFYIEQKPLDMK